MGIVGLIWRLESRTHNTQLLLVNHCKLIDIQLNKRRIKFVYKLFNSEHLLHGDIVYYSLNNMTTATMSENIRHIYFMCTYDIDIDEWKGSYNNILSKIMFHCYLHMRI